uniref:Cancer susceptibility candidate 5 n=2 Tax=Nothobranchius rachovii TaxID=451742 RepID=A0A1A8QZR6_9TELE
MEPLDPAKNVEGSGHSRRRISSILKVTRKSSGTCESEQQENEVESAKPFEKRNSRRVSFAPATDVLVFAKDVKTASPTRNPLQELIAATDATTQNRVQMAATDDGTQQIMGIENLLSAPLHGSQQSNMVSCDIPNDFGEKTVVFSTEDADMGETCSHTINFTGDVETLKTQTHHDIFHTVGERRVVSDGMFADVSLSHTAATSSLPAVLFSGQKKDSSLVTKIPFVIPDFENIPASLSKPSGFSSRTPLTGSSSEDTKSKGQTAIDKENQIPTLLSCSRNRSASCPEDEGLGMAVDPGVVDEEDDDDPFQCLFSAQDMYAHSDKRSSTVTEKKPEGSCERSGSVELIGSASFTKPRDLSGNPEIPTTRPVTVPCSKATINTDGFPLQTPEAEVDRKEWALDNSKSCGILFDGGIKSSEEDMDLTDVHRGKILEKMGSNDLFGVVFLSQGSNPAERTPAQEGVETSLQPFLKTQPQIHQVKPTTVKDYEEKTQRLSADDCMDVTKSHALKIDADVRLQLHQSVNLSPATRAQTLRLAADDTAMDMTQCLTENAVSHLASDSDSSVGKGEDKTCDPTLSRSLSSHCWTTGYKNLQINPVRAQMGPFASQSDGFAVNPKDDISMGVTELQTGYILGGHVTMDVKDVQLLSQATHPQSVHPKMEPMTSQQQSNTDHRPSSSKETLMGISLKTLQRLEAKFASEDPHREKTVRFTAADADMDVTQYHTVNIIHDLPPHSISNVDSPANGVKMVRLTTDDAAMDVTRSHTESVSSHLNKPSHQFVNLPPDGEKTVRFTTNDASIDVTRSHTANISTDLNTFSHQNVHQLPANGERTERFTLKRSLMDMTKSHTASIPTTFEPKLYQNVELQPTSVDETQRFTTEDACKDMTSCFTVNTTCNLASETVSLDQNMKFPPSVEKTNSGDCAPLSNRSSSAQVEQKYKSSTTQEADATDTPLPQEPAASCNFQLKTQKADTDAATESPSVVSDVVGKPVMETVTSCAEIGVTDILHQDVSSTQDHRSDHLETREFSGNNTFLGSSISEVEAFNPSNYLDSNKMETAEEPLQTTEAFPEKAEPSAEGPDVDTKRSRTSRRISLADLRSKVRRLSNKFKAAADVAEDPGAAPVPPPDLDMDKTSSSKTGPLPVVQPTFETSFETNTDDERPFAATPINLKVEQLMSQLAVGRFKPKLPQRTNPDRSKRLASAGKATRTFPVGVTSRLSNLDDVDLINDEELGGFEDLSETLDIRDAEKSFEKETSPKVDLALKLLDEPEGLVSPIQGQKRPLEDEDEDERSLKACFEHVGMTCEPLVERDGNTAASHTTTQSVSSSSCSHTDSRCQAALEDYDDDGLGKLKDGTITVQEFFKLFKIDFVIHNPRQSILPGKLLFDSDVTPLDLLKNRYINRPRQAVYEADVQILTAKVEGLKVRKKDLDKSLKIVNKHLWEEMRHFSENELKSFGAKLKEKNNFFKKLAKVKSHEMKEELYSNLVRTSREQQQKVRGKIEEADKTIKHLDECICELEAEIFAVEEKGFGDKPGLKSLQEELTKVSDAVADKERQMSDLELEKKQNSSKLEQIKEENSSLQKQIDILNMMSEWRLGERSNKSTCFTFLHGTMFLQLEYEQLERSDADSGCEKKITNIAFKFELDPEKSQPHARLVHKLVSQYMEGESGWVEKYSTSQDVPKLLHDVSLVVSRCRMLGEEIRLLKMWGGLRFDILDISCMDTQVRVVFSSMKRCSKFEVVFDVSLTNQLCAFQVQSFKNVFGSSSIQQIEDIVASLASGRKLLTRIIKKIHETLLQ